MTCSNRDLWSKHFSKLSIEYPDQIKTITSAICLVILTDMEPKNESEQLKFGMFNDCQDIWADKTLSFFAFKNGAISSQSEVSTTKLRGVELLKPFKPGFGKKILWLVRLGQKIYQDFIKSSVFDFTKT